LGIGVWVIFYFPFTSNHTNLNNLMGNLGINVILLAGCESRGNRFYNYKVYIMLNIK